VGRIIDSLWFVVRNRLIFFFDADRLINANRLHFEIDVSKIDLTCIKTGFVWVVGAKGKPAAFYLDDIRYE